MNSADYGFPQSRKRIYIVCFRKDMGIINFEFPIPCDDVKHKYVKDIVCKNGVEHYVINRSDITITADDSAAECTDKPFRIGSVAQGRQGERIYSAKGKAITLTANGGGIGGKCGLYKIDGKIRKLTPRECARLQGFPDGWTDLHGKVKTNKDGTTTLVEGETSDSARYKALGNSMAVPVMKWIGERIVRVSVSPNGGDEL